METMNIWHVFDSLQRQLFIHATGCGIIMRALLSRAVHIIRAVLRLNEIFPLAAGLLHRLVLQVVCWFSLPDGGTPLDRQMLDRLCCVLRSIN